MAQYIVSSGTVSGITLGSGSTMSVFHSGTAKHITVTAGGTMSAYAGGVTSAAKIAGGTEFVSAGGSSYNTSLSKGGVEVVSGGVSYSTAIGAGTLESVYGGTAIDTAIAAGGVLNFSGSTASGTVINSGGTFNLFGGTAFNTTLNGGVAVPTGTETILGDAVASGTTMYGGIQYVSAGIAIDTVLSGNALQEVEQNGVARFTTLDGPSQQDINGGLAISTTVGSGATQGAEFGAEASETTVLNGGFQYIDGAAAYGSVVEAGGTMDIDESGVSYDAQIMNGGVMSDMFLGVTSNTTVMAGGSEVLSSSDPEYYSALSVNTKISGGTETVGAGGVSSNTTVMAGGLEVLSSNDGYRVLSVKTEIMSGGTEMVGSGGVASKTFIEGGELEILSGGNATGSIVFAGSSGELLIDQTTMPGAEIENFEPGDSIVLAALPYSAGDTATVEKAGIVTISAGGAEYNLHIAGAMVGETDFVFGPGSILTKDTPQMTFLRPPVSLHSQQTPPPPNFFPVSTTPNF